VASPVRHVLDVDRVGILTDGVADSMERWNERLDLVVEHVEESEAGDPIETSSSQPGIEFLSPATDDGQLAERLEADGPGVHALVLGVADLDEATAELAEDVLEPIMESEAEKRRAAFDSPTEFDGVLLEFTEYAHPMDRE
jgi:methylmalonyl-CoA/ethylmalonyl-CoA epimerase